MISVLYPFVTFPISIVSPEKLKFAKGGKLYAGLPLLLSSVFDMRGEEVG